MRNYECFTFVTLALFTLTDFTAAEYTVPVDQLSVKQVNEQLPGSIPATIDVNSSAKSWLIQLNRWDPVSQTYARNLWSGLKDYLYPQTVELDDLTVEQKLHFVKELIGSSSTNNACASD